MTPTDLERRRRILGLALTLAVWTLGYSYGRLSGMVKALGDRGRDLRLT